MSNGSFSTTPQERYLEDYVEGTIHEFGPVTITEDEIVQFGKKFDPQLFHTDSERAGQTVYGGLIASGWHTCALYMRLIYDGLLHDSSSQGSPGMEELRWPAPVRPGDRLTATSIVEEVTPSATKPNRGTVILRSEMCNQDGVVVLRMRGRGLYGRRPA